MYLFTAMEVVQPSHSFNTFFKFVEKAIEVWLPSDDMRGTAMVQDAVLSM